MLNTSAKINKKEQFEVYIKTVIDIERSICSTGMDRHFEEEQIKLHQGSEKKNLWGAGE